MQRPNPAPPARVPDRLRNPSTRRAVVHALEERRLFAAVFPSAIEQYELQVVNRLRADPAAEVGRHGADAGWDGTPDLNEGLPPGTLGAQPRQPLAWNPLLGDAARKHSQWMLDNQKFEHVQDVGGRRIGPTDRVAAAGYTPQPGTGAGENLARTITDDAVTTANHLNQLLFVDSGVPSRGHRLALLNGGANEAGFGIVEGQFDGAPFSMLTQNFANAGRGSFLLGVAIQDLNNDQFYQPGEGLGGVTITATRTSDNQAFTATTWDAGGYSLKLDPGTYVVTAGGGDVGTPAPKTVTVGAQNVAADFVKAAAAPAVPVIVTQPKDTTPFLSATTFSFSVGATGNPTPSVRWQVAPFQSTNFTDVPGATGFTYTAPVDPNLNGNQYRAVLTNSAGSVTSNPATLTVQNGAKLPIEVTVRPRDQTVNAGDTVTFTAAATGATKISWNVETPDGEFTEIPGATTGTLTLTADASMNGNSYWVFFDNSTGGTSVPAKLTVNAGGAAPKVVAQPQPVVATEGGDATFTVDAGGFPDPDVDWQFFNGDEWVDFGPGDDFDFDQADPDLNTTFDRARGLVRPTATVLGNADGTTTASITFPASATLNKREYRAVVSNGIGTVTTQAVRLSVNGKTELANERKSLATAVRAALAAVEECRKATVGHLKVLAADLKRLDASDAAHAALRKLQVWERDARVAFLRNQKALFGQLTKLSASVDADARRLARRPGDVAAQARLQANVAALQSVAASSTAASDATECKLTQVEALAELAAAAPGDADLAAHVVAAGQTAHDVSQALAAPVRIALGVVGRIVNQASA